MNQSSSVPADPVPVLDLASPHHPSAAVVDAERAWPLVP